jgi:hypothetical protein
MDPYDYDGIGMLEVSHYPGFWECDGAQQVYSET